jgi:hypothetical protein
MAMLDNDLYDLLAQAVEENKSLWRIQNYYLADSNHHPEDKGFWGDLWANKEERSDELMNLIRNHFIERKIMK